MNPEDPSPTAPEQSKGTLSNANSPVPSKASEVKAPEVHQKALSKARPPTDEQKGLGGAKAPQ